MPPGGFKTENVQSLASVLGGPIYIHALTQSEALFLTLKSQVLVFKFIYLFLAALGLRCCMRAFSSCRAQASHCGGFSFQSVGSKVCRFQ